MKSSIKFRILKNQARTGDHIYIGVAKRGANLTSYLGSDVNGWSIYRNGFTTYHSGANVVYAAKNGQEVEDDIITVTLDTLNGKLSYSLNGEQFDIAFPDDAAAAVLKGDDIFPAVSMYYQHDSIEII